MASRGLVLVAACAALVALVGCHEDRLVESACREDSQCDEGYLCEDFVCIEAATKACDVVIDGNPILQPSPYTASFGELDTPETQMTVQLHNLGNCTLTIFEMGLESAANPEAPPSPFSCDLCEGKMPIEIFPGRHKDLVLTFKANGVGKYSDQLRILSDDREFPELKVPIHANFLGVPQLRVAPNPIDFGYVAQGRALKKAVSISNQGTGVAPLTVSSVLLAPADSQDFELTGSLDAPVDLAPASTDETAILNFELTYHPRSNGLHSAELIVVTSKGDVHVPISGNSETPPKLTFNPTSINLGQVPLGHTNYQALTLVNEGGAPLHVSYSWGGPNPTTDLYALPSVLPEIQPGAYQEVQVAVTATAVGPYNGLLILSSDDPATPAVTIPVTAEGVPGPGPEVVKVEMTYENGADSAFDNDLRNVDLTLEHPYGYVCNKQNPSPTNWGNYGNPTWIAFAPKEEPERVVLADAVQDGTYRVMLSYAEDCASIPTELMAGILGISVDALIAYLSGGAININGQDVGDLISEICLDHASSNVTVRVYVNGQVIKEKTVTVGKKGDSLYAVDLIRSGGTFSAK
ncbi:MAG: choice-of-anchor D domain-containing protein [Myxococcaceae bacterium]|nr:choice-of-anchor D domain-containing protein [Myxococcaceae bacterium]